MQTEIGAREIDIHRFSAYLCRGSAQRRTKRFAGFSSEGASARRFPFGNQSCVTHHARDGEAVLLSVHPTSASRHVAYREPVLGRAAL